ncbi:MAG: N-6 DNA methylase [Patescibacteria group bacterium]
MTASITELVEKFARNIAEYKNPKYNETQVRVEFVNPFWELLGWDVNNVSGYSLAFRDVIHEDEVRVGLNTKAPDYSFRIGGKRIFFLETKKPSVDLKNDPAPAFQLRRYAYSAKLPVSILTDFEEFIVYDTTLKPAITDKTHVGRMLYYTYQEYVENWESIHAAFSKEAVLRGDFERFIQNKQGKKPRAEIDRDFLNDLDNWRILLARNIALRNLNLSERELNYAVQFTIDRLIFLRMSEDRGIETQYPLQSLLNGERIYPRLVEIYYRADERYNSGLFHFNEKDGINPDTITPTLTIDDKLLKEIVRNLYYPDCPYEFSVLPVEVLGNAYEQFLGKRISLTAGHHARIEEKPEVRKAGGVYYTPQYIVDYIVKNTVGKLLEDKTPANVSELRILDPACGSGSFLLGAYQYLMDWHLEYYRKEYEKTGVIPVVKAEKGKRKAATQAIFSGKGGDWFLATAEKKRILLNNLYGVDIDSNAVEVTKLSLLLKVLENENSETLARQLGLWHERALPNLANNIKCGNSLIGPDYYEQKQANLFDEKEALRINVFDWEKEFPEIFSRKDAESAKGFDAVIGNPPYVRPQNLSQEIKKLLWAHYTTFVAKSDLYSCFMERAIKLIRPTGLFGFIVPQTWTSLESFTKIREFMTNRTRIIKLVQLPKKVFANATVETCIFIVQRIDEKMNEKDDQIVVEHIDVGGAICPVREFRQRDIDNAYLYNFQLYGRESSQSVIDKVKQVGKPLSDFIIFMYGFKTGDDNQFIHKSKNYNESKFFIRSANIKRYWHDSPCEYVWYVPEKMTQNRKTARPGETTRFEAEKILVARMGKILIATYDQGGLYVKDAMLLLDKGSMHSLKYLLGVINSRLVNYFYQEFFITIDVLKNALLSIPIRTIDFNNPADKARHDRMVSLVETMLALHKRLPEVNTPQEKEVIQRQITATDSQIDKLVYELYDLTDAEIAIVEGNMSA